MLFGWSLPLGLRGNYVFVVSLPLALSVTLMRRKSAHGRIAAL